MLKGFYILKRFLAIYERLINEKKIQNFKQFELSKKNIKLIKNEENKLIKQMKKQKKQDLNELTLVI